MNRGLIPGLAVLAYVPFVFYIAGRFPPAKAAVIGMLGAALVLPVGAGYDLPLLPLLDKQVLPSAALLVALLLKVPRRQAQLSRKFVFGLFALNVLCAIGTFLTNPESYSVGVLKQVFMPGLRARDAYSLSIVTLGYVFLPFYVGAIASRNVSDLESVLRILVKVGLLLSLLCLYEVRMSPRLHEIVYGYAAHGDFGQTRRWGGYRPQVFFYHGLVAAFFMLNATLATTVAFRIRMPLGLKFLKLNWVLPYMMLVLVLCKSTGAIAYATFVVPVMLIFKSRTQLLIAVCLALIVVTYPYTRTTQAFPTDTLLTWAESISVERAASLNFRFSHEEHILEKSLDAGKIWFGWGGYGRYHLFDEWTGEDLSTVDGRWIIEIGSRGVLGLLIKLTLLLWPVWMAFRARRKFGSERNALMVAAVALMIAVAAVEMLPNDPRLSLHWFLAGTLYGVSRGVVEAGRRRTSRATVFDPATAYRPPS